MSKQRKKREGLKRRAGSKFWWASFTDGSGKRVQRSTRTTSKGEALNLLNSWKTQVWNQEARGIEPDRTFEQLVVAYLNGTKDEKRSSDTDVRRFRVLAAFFPEGLVMNTLSATDITGYVGHRQSHGVTNKTINKELSLLSVAIRWSKKRLGWDLPNPVLGHRLPEVNEEARCLTVDEFRRLLTATKATKPHTAGYLYDFCILGFHTMMRPGEMLALEWARVDFNRKEVLLGIEDTKGKAKRLVPLNDYAYAALLRLRRRCDNHFRDAQFVFTHTSPRLFGGRIKSVSKVFETAVQRAGIPHATPHALRHTAITEGVHAEGVSIVDVSHIAGHKDLKTTMGYIHSAPERLHQAVANLPAVGGS
jgi:integrase